MFVDYGSGLSGYTARDALDRVGTSMLSNGTVLFLGRGSSCAGGSTTYGYDGIGRLATMTNNTDGSATTNDISRGFSYSPAGQITNWNYGVPLR